MGATLAGLGLSLWLAHGLLAPVSLARLALHAYRREQRLLPLPLDLDGEAGGLLSDLRATIETRSEERRVGKEWVSTCRARGAPYHKKTNKTISQKLKEDNKTIYI